MKIFSHWKLVLVGVLFTILTTANVRGQDEEATSADYESNPTESAEVEKSEVSEAAVTDEINSDLATSTLPLPTPGLNNQEEADDKPEDKPEEKPEAKSEVSDDDVLDYGVTKGDESEDHKPSDGVLELQSTLIKDDDESSPAKTDAPPKVDEDEMPATTPVASVDGDTSDPAGELKEGDGDSSDPAGDLKEGDSTVIAITDELEKDKEDMPVTEDNESSGDSSESFDMESKKEGKCHILQENEQNRFNISLHFYFLFYSEM